MNKDDDRRLLADGEYRNAENVMVVNSQGSDVGAIENEESTTKLTNLPLGENVKTITPNPLADNSRNKIYWMVKSNTGCYLIEFDQNSGTSSIVLADTRPLNTRVFNLSENHLITGFEKLLSERTEDDLLLWTDDNMEPCCINIERAKTWGENNFTKEDIYLIKAPPKYAPIATPISTTEQNNYINEKFFSFAYRYRFKDGEYSALSSFTRYTFIPEKYKTDFVNGLNSGMVNRFNAVNIQFSTGSKRVVEIEIIAKASNSVALYKIATFNKEKEFWRNNQIRSTTFSNNKIYSTLADREYFRLFDNVPLKAKALAIIGNRPVFGNYVEGRDLIDKNGVPIKIDLVAGFNSYNAEGEDLYSFVMSDEANFIFYNQSNETGSPVQLKEGSVLVFLIVLDPAIFSGRFESEFTFILQDDYPTFNALANDPAFINFVEVVMTETFGNNYTPTGLPDGSTVNGIRTGFSILSSTNSSITLKAPTVSVTIPEDNTFDLLMKFVNQTSVTYANSALSPSIKSMYDYELGIKYLDEFNRSTTPLVSSKNTFFVPIENSVTQNKATLRIFNLPPAWAERYKVVVKAQPLTYNIIYASQFYTDGIYRWVKLEGENKDKVKEGDVLILKQDRSGPVGSVVEVKVLDALVQQEDFITDNTDSLGNEIKEPAGFYMKIHPTGFPMEYKEDEFLEAENMAASTPGRPIAYCELFSVEDEGNPTQYLDKPLIPGNVVTFFFRSRRRNRTEIVFEKSYTIQQPYDNFKDWFDAELNNVVFTGNDNQVFDQVDVVRGLRVREPALPQDTIWGLDADANGRRYLRVRGVYGGNGNNRRGFLDVKVSLRTSEGVFVFETKPKRTEQEIFYETEETFDIEDGLHLGNVQNQFDGGVAQDTVVDPAIVELNFHNCYTFGNGVESYQAEDSMLKDKLVVDLRPSATLFDEYRSIRRTSDITWGEPYNEGFNGLNEFNQSTQNFKPLDKKYGSIQKLFNRDTNIVVAFENKTGYVLYEKDAISTAIGQETIVRSSEIFGEFVPYLGDNGIGLHPESWANDQFRIYYVNPNRGTPIRLSMDGTEEINNKMVSWFRDKLVGNPFGNKIGGFDPRHRRYVLSFKDGQIPSLVAKFDAPISYYNIDEETSYFIVVDSVVDKIYIDLDVEEGTGILEAEFDGDKTAIDVYPDSYSLEVPTGKTGIMEVKITPETPITMTVLNRKGENTELEIVLITIGDVFATSKTVTNRYSWGNNPFYEEDIFFSPSETDESGELLVPQFFKEAGNEGVGRFPLNGTNVNIQSLKGPTDSIDFDEEFFIGYLVSETEYQNTAGNIEEILELATFPTLTVSELTENTFIKSGNFLFSRNNENEILYLIWDYRRIESETSGSEISPSS